MAKSEMEKILDRINSESQKLIEKTKEAELEEDVTKDILGKAASIRVATSEVKTSLIIAGVA